MLKQRIKICSPIFFFFLLSISIITHCGQNPFSEQFLSTDPPFSCTSTSDCPGAMVCKGGKCSHPKISKEKNVSSEREDEDCFPFCDAGDEREIADSRLPENQNKKDDLLTESENNTERITDRQCSVEICDKKDNDCDGIIDENCPCYYQKKREGVCKKAKIGDDGQCKKPRKYSDKEICGDGEDNDCDGSAEEGCQCTPGTKRPCGSDVGECKKGIQTCEKSGQWRACTGAVPPASEICDGKDNDCDGKIDESDPNLGKSCNTGKPGICSFGKYLCSNAKLLCQPPEPKPEICDGKDNDCDGKVDESDPNLGKSCNTGKPGICSFGKYLCSNAKLLCTGQKPQPERCDNSIDDDCDGLTDEGCPCKYKGLDRGVCQRGRKDGKGGCSPPTEYSSTEKCGDKLDNNCDGIVDEGCPCYYMGLTKGVCASARIDKKGLCTKPNGYNVIETCDGLDNNCDGYIDNIPNSREQLYTSCYNAPASTMGWGYCKGGKKLCIKGKWGGCLYSVIPAKSEVCDNGLDDNCDGLFSEKCKICPIYKKSQFYTKLQGGVFPHSVAAVKPGTDHLAVGAGNYSGTVKIWFATRDMMFRTFSLPPKEKALVRALAFDPSLKNKILAIGLSDNTIRLYQYQYQKEHITQILYLPAQPYSIDFFPDGVHIGVGTSKGYFVFTRYSGTPRYAHPYSLYPTIAKLSKSGKILAAIRGPKVYIWKVTNAFLYKGIAIVTPKDTPQALLFTPSEDNLIIVGKYSISLWNISNRKITTPIKSSEQITSVDIDPTGKTLILTKENLSAEVWDMKTLKLIEKLKLVGYSSTTKGFKPIVKFISKGLFVTISSPKNKYNSYTQNILLWKNPGYEWSYLYRSPEILDSLAVSDSSEFAVTGDQKGNLFFWNLSSQKPKLYSLRKVSVQPNSGVRALEYLYPVTKRHFFISAHSDGYLKVWNNSGSNVGKYLLSKSYYPRRLSFHQKRSILAVGMSSGSIRLYKVNTSTTSGVPSLSFLNELKGHTSYINSVEFNSDGTYLFSSSLDGTVRVWDVSTSSSIQKITSTAQNPMKIPRTVVAHPMDSRLFAFAEDGGYIYWWKIGGNIPSDKIKVGSTIKDIFIEPGGKYIFALIDINKSILIYEIASGKLVNTIYTEGYPSRIKYLEKFGQFIYTNYNFPVIIGCP